MNEENRGYPSSVNAQTDFRSELSKNLYDFACFIKPYEGNFWRPSGQLTNIRFCDERESGAMCQFCPTMISAERG